MTRFLLLVGLAALAGCKDEKPKFTIKSGSIPTTSPDNPSAASPGAGNTNSVAGGGAVQNVRQAARRTVALNDMAGLGKFITAQEIELGKMPSKADITNALKSDPSYRTISDAITDGTIVLTGSTKREGLWAYETEADTKGGIGLVGGVANRYSADEIKNLQRGG